MNPTAHGHGTWPKFGIELVHAGILAAPKVEGGAAPCLGFIHGREQHGGGGTARDFGPELAAEGVDAGLVLKHDKATRRHTFSLLVEGQHRKGPRLVGQTIQQRRQFGAVVRKAFAGSGSQVKRMHVLLGFRVFRDGHGPFIAQESYGLLLPGFAHVPTFVFGPCALPCVSRDVLPPVRCLKALMGAGTEIQHVEHCRHACARRHQVLLGVQIALESHVQGPRRSARQGEQTFQGGAGDTHRTS